MISLTLECCSVLTVQWWHSPSAKIFWYQIFSLALRHSSLSCKWDSLMSLFLHSGLSLFKLKTPDDWGGVNILPEELENIQNWKSWIVYQHILGFIKQNEDPWSRSKLCSLHNGLPWLASCLARCSRLQTGFRMTSSPPTPAPSSHPGQESGVQSPWPLIGQVSSSQPSHGPPGMYVENSTVKNPWDWESKIPTFAKLPSMPRIIWDLRVLRS